jgi:hypothetical protein
LPASLWVPVTSREPFIAPGSVSAAPRLRQVRRLTPAGRLHSVPRHIATVEGSR